MSSEKELDKDFIEKEIPLFHKTKLNLASKAERIIKILEGYLQELESSEFDTTNGNSLLDVKNHYLSQQLIDLTDIISCRVQGKSIQNNGTVERLCESRTVLEKIKPLELKIQYRLEQIMSNNGDVGSMAEDPNNFKPNLDNLVSDNEDDDEDSGSDADIDDVMTSQSASGKYVAPHITETKMENESRARRQERERERQLQKSTILQDAFDDLSGDEAVEYQNDPEFGRKNKMKQMRKDRVEYEETHFVRTMQTKKEKNREKQQMRIGNDFNQLHKFNSDFLNQDKTGQEGQRKKKRRKGRKRRRH